MNYNHLNINERACIYQFKILGMSIGKIAKALSSCCFVTLSERKSRLYIAKHIPDRKDETVTKSIIELLNNYPK